MPDISKLAAEVKPTVPAYWNDSYRREYVSKIILVEPDEKRHYYVVLDETIFYPKGGGQPSDRGFLNGPSFKFQVKKMKRHASAHLLDYCLGRAARQKMEALDSWLGDPACYVAYKGSVPSERVLTVAEELVNQVIDGDTAVDVFLDVQRAQEHFPAFSFRKQLR